MTKISRLINPAMIKGGSNIQDIEFDANRKIYVIDMFNPRLKIGGYDDNDSNDSEYFDELVSMFKDNIKDKELQYVDASSHEKGRFSIHVRLLSEKDKYQKIESINNKLSILENKRDLFIKSTSDKMKDRISKKITCKNCDSSLNVNFLLKKYTKNLCPVCMTVMYTDTEQKKLDSFDAKIAILREERKVFDD